MPSAEEDEFWKTADLSKIYDSLNCPDKQRIHDTETWKLLQSTYEKSVKKSSMPKGGFIGLDGFYVPYKVKKGKHGRGIFATKPIPKGTLVWRSFQTARFEDPAEYRQFLHDIPAELACDVIPWAYTRLERTKTDDLRVVVCVDLDPGSFVNEGMTKFERNLKVATPRWTGCKLEFYATRDILIGEELRINYRFSEMDPGFSALGLRQDIPSVFETEDLDFDWGEYEDFLDWGNYESDSDDQPSETNTESTSSSSDAQSLPPQANTMGEEL